MSSFMNDKTFPFFVSFVFLIIIIIIFFFLLTVNIFNAKSLFLKREAAA